MVNLLLIDDDAAYAQVIVKILEAHDFQVTHAPNAFLGLQQARALHPDMILIDMHLPDLDGKVVALQLCKFQVARRVQETFRASGLDIIDVDGVRVRFPHGWGLLRASNTQPVLVMRFEAESPAHLAEYRTTVERAVATARSAVERG